MYVENMDLDEARAWEDELSGKLYHKGARMTGPEYLQASQDLEDVRERIAELNPSTTTSSTTDKGLRRLPSVPA